jgi:hypothetical protein
VSIADMALDRGSVFEFVSHRRVWVDFKRGGSLVLSRPTIRFGEAG